MSPQTERFIKALSRLLGWIYTLCWSASFYPQPIANFRRRSTTGLAIDFHTVNVLGFACYAVYTIVFLYSPVIRGQYAARHPLSEEPTVRGNDLAFAVHAVVLSIIGYSQFWPRIWGFAVSRHQKASKPIKVIWWGSVVAVGVVIGLVLGRSPDGGYDPRTWAWIDVIYTLSYVKLLITMVKYAPQAYLNFKRKSTEGWRIEMILLDITGGLLSLIQLLLDSSFNKDWSGITGNPAKFLLSNVSIAFDLLFMVQHYVLYRGADRESKRVRLRDGERDEPSLVTPLLVEPEGLERAASV